MERSPRASASASWRRPGASVSRTTRSSTAAARDMRERTSTPRNAYGIEANASAPRALMTSDTRLALLTTLLASWRQSATTMIPPDHRTGASGRRCSGVAAWSRRQMITTPPARTATPTSWSMAISRFPRPWS